MADHVTPELCQSMHSKLNEHLQALTSSVNTLNERFATFATAVAVHTTQVARMQKDIDGLQEQDRRDQQVIEEHLKKLESRLEKIEVLVQQGQGVVKTVKVLWALFGASVLGWLAIAWDHFKGGH